MNGHVLIFQRNERETTVVFQRNGVDFTYIPRPRLIVRLVDVLARNEIACKVTYLARVYTDGHEEMTIMHDYGVHL